MENEGEGKRGVETISVDDSKTELLMKKKGKHKSTTSIGASLTPDYREQEENNKTDLDPSVDCFTTDATCSTLYFHLGIALVQRLQLCNHSKYTLGVPRDTPCCY